MSSRQWWRNHLVYPLAVVVFTGCALAGSQRRGAGTEAPEAQPIPVHVTNKNLLDVNIYAIGSGQSMWLGLVTSKETTTFQLPESFVSHGPIRVRVAPVGAAGGFDSDPVLVGRDDELDLTVASLDLGVSVLSIGPAQSDTTGS